MLKTISVAMSLIDFAKSTVNHSLSLILIYYDGIIVIIIKVLLWKLSMFNLFELLGENSTNVWKKKLYHKTTKGNIVSFHIKVKQDELKVFQQSQC